MTTAAAMTSTAAKVADLRRRLVTPGSVHDVYDFNLRSALGS